MPESKHTLIGKQGEFLVLANLASMGLPSYHVDAADTDIVCISTSERPIRVQVKTVRFDTTHNILIRKHYFDHSLSGEKKHQKKSYTEKDFEILACVILDTEEIFYLNMKAFKELSTERSGSITPKKLRLFTYNLTVYQSWNKAVSKYYPGYKVELDKDGSVISGFDGNGFNGSECSESQLQQGVLF